MKVHYPKLYNMAHLLSLNVFAASKGSNNYILFMILDIMDIGWLVSSWLVDITSTVFDAPLPDCNVMYTSQSICIIA